MFQRPRGISRRVDVLEPEICSRRLWQRDKPYFFVRIHIDIPSPRRKNCRSATFPGLAGNRLMHALPLIVVEFLVAVVLPNAIGTMELPAVISNRTITQTSAGSKAPVAGKPEAWWVARIQPEGSASSSHLPASWHCVAALATQPGFRLLI